MAQEKRFPVVLVTGASSGIGRALALAIAPHSGQLHLVGRDRVRLEETAEVAAARGARPRLHALDLGEDPALDGLAADLASDARGRLDVLVHAAGAVALAPVESAAIDDLDRQYRVNVRVPYRLTQRLLPPLRAARGQIVFVNSGAGLHARAGWSQYAITKHGLRALADSLREELGPAGVRVISVFPGRTATPMQEAVHRMEGRPYDPARFLQPDDVASLVLSALLLPDTASVTDLSIRPASG
jgi:NAD(P)-dependent dehydrogenase (short-subunit alcohol dehydrogenase family)